MFTIVSFAHVKPFPKGLLYGTAAAEEIVPLLVIFSGQCNSEENCVHFNKYETTKRGLRQGKKWKKRSI